MLKVHSKLSLPHIWLAASWVGYGERAALCVLIELVLTWKDALAAHTPEVIALKVVVQCDLVWSVEVASGLQTVLVF